ncbi:tumor suppressor protein Gltscr2 [Mucidula mucida]|nr:tumor suppressor protein Gltscr2 [Mucidula mucida]
MSASASSSKKRGSAVGAPAQHSQSSRKGKRAWRKNVNIEDVEEGMEVMRDEERVWGTAVQKVATDDLFVVDTTGDDQIRKTVAHSKSLQTTASRILAQRSAVPAVFSRTTTSTKRKTVISKEEKERLLRIAKRPRKGPLNSYVDPTEIGAGSAIMGLTEAVRRSGGYDPWTESVQEPAEAPMGTEHLQKKVFKAPVYTKPRDLIEVPAVVEPHLGTSYNPPVHAHQELLLKAHEIEEKRVLEAEKQAVVKKRMEQARVDANAEDIGALGMTLDAPTADTIDVEEDATISFAKAMPERKTKQQRRKAEKALAEKRALAHKIANKKMMSIIERAKFLRKEAHKTSQQRAEERRVREQALAARLKRGLSGHKLGKHKVAEGNVDVQLGEDLSESLRALKVEGNMFRDRFISLQQRGRLEPRALVLPKKRRRETIEYEKHAWKRFE